MDDVIYDFLDYLKLQKNYSDYTETNYNIDLEDFKNYVNEKKINYKKLEYQDILTFTKYLSVEKHLNSVSVNRHLSSIRSFYNYLVSEQIILTNPFKLIKGPKKPIKLPNYMKYDEFEKMIDACDETDLGVRNRALLELLLATGARIGELINLEIKDIDLDRNEIKVFGKGSKERICYFNEHCKYALIEYITDARNNLLKEKVSNRLFINHIGGELTTRGVRSIIDKIIQTSSINTKITPHTFRHTFATMLLNEGCDLRSVQELLGHVNMSTTSIYTHITNDRIKDIYLHTHPRSKK